MRTHLIILTLTLEAIACTHRTAPNSSPLASRNSAVLSSEQLEMKSDGPYRDLARVAPSHGGWYFDTLTGDLTVYLKDMTEGPAAKRTLPALLAGGLARARARHPQAGIVPKQGSYTFIELARWRDTLDEFLGPPSVQLWGIDFANNRIIIGVLAGADTQAIVAKALELGVPEGALRFERTGRIQPLDAQASDTVPARLTSGRDTAAIIVPDTVRRGQAFTAKVTVFAGGCIRQGAGSRVKIHGLVADVTLLHVRRVEGDVCYSDEIIFHETISVRFDRAGLGRIRFHGVTNQLDFRAEPRWVVIERTVVVRGR